MDEYIQLFGETYQEALMDMGISITSASNSNGTFLIRWAQLVPKPLILIIVASALAGLIVWRKYFTA